MYDVKVRLARKFIENRIYKSSIDGNRLDFRAGRCLGKLTVTVPSDGYPGVSDLDICGELMYAGLGSCGHATCGINGKKLSSGSRKNKSTKGN